MFDLGTSLIASVARDLIATGVTSAAKLACHGGSNGGLLVGNMLTRYPELFGAIWCSVPLLDMARYTKLLAGQSWIASSAMSRSTWKLCEPPR